MRLLAFSDLHRDRAQARRLAAMAAGADVVIGAGEFASMRLGVERTIDEPTTLDQPVLLVPGNNESLSALWRAGAFRGLSAAAQIVVLQDFLHGQDRKAAPRRVVLGWPPVRLAAPPRPPSSCSLGSVIFVRSQLPSRSRPRVW
jgi:hypothetical protein